MSCNFSNLPTFPPTEVDIKNELITNNLGLIVKIARYYVNDLIDSMALNAEGNMVLIKTAQDYSWMTQEEFRPIAEKAIRRAMVRKRSQTESLVAEFEPMLDDLIAKYSDNDMSEDELRCTAMQTLIEAVGNFNFEERDDFTWYVTINIDAALTDRVHPPSPR